jgi:hypothetical protein
MVDDEITETEKELNNRTTKNSNIYLQMKGFNKK